MNIVIKKILLGILLILGVLVLGFVYFQDKIALLISSTKQEEPQVQKAPEKPPFFSTSYTYSVTPKSSTTVLLGSQEVPIDKVRETIQHDMWQIKDMGFDGIKLIFLFNQSNAVTDQIAAIAKSEGLIPYGILQGHTQKPAERPFTEEELVKWHEFVGSEVQKNKDIIYFWEIWNEPDLELFRYGTPEEFLTFLKGTYPIIKKENPLAKAVVTLDAFDPLALEFSESLLSIGGGDYFDIVSFHPYGVNPFLQEDIYTQSIKKEKELMAKYKDKWPLWITEIGQPISEVTEDVQGKLAEFVFDRAYKEKIPVTWFYYSDERAGGRKGWGLIRPDGSKRSSFIRMKDFLQRSKNSIQN